MNEQQNEAVKAARVVLKDYGESSEGFMNACTALGVDYPIDTNGVITMLTRAGVVLLNELTALRAENAELKARAMSDKFWKDCYPEGMTAEGVRNELHDFHVMIEEVPKVYSHVTGHQLSKHLTRAEHIIAAHDEHMQESIDEAVAEESSELRGQLATARTALECATKSDQAWVRDAAAYALAKIEGQSRATGIHCFDGNINKHPLHRAVYELCLEIESLPASEQQTKVIIMACGLQDKVAAALAQIAPAGGGEKTL